MKDYIFEMKMKVRDYECDAQGIVNNANYQHYMEHTRHEFILSRGIRFSELHEQGIDPVVARITLEYKSPLKGGDEFVSKLNVKKEGIRYVFEQHIYRVEDERIASKLQLNVSVSLTANYVPTRHSTELSRMSVDDL